ncbi:MAG: ABC transporter ATP-binding protein [Burkholderiaceae bacterium]
MSLVEAVGLCKRFGDFTAVDDIGFTVGRGEVVGFLGPNGAGKSTTMKMLTGFLEPDEGSARIGGHDVVREPVAARAMLGYLPEGAPAYGEMTVADFLAFVGRMRGMGGAGLRNRMAEMVDRVHLADVWNRQVDNLSKGYKRRVGIAQALLHDPDVLILDEPTDGLDPNQKHEMRTLIRSIASAKAIIVSTHILEEVEAVCTRAIVIANGRLLADDTPTGLVSARRERPALAVTVVRDDLERARDALAAWADGDIAHDEHASLVRLRLALAASSTAVPAEIAARLRADGLHVVAADYLQPSLEDVFREMTREPNRAMLG